MNTTGKIQQHIAKISPRARLAAIIVASLATIMDLLDSTIVNVATPNIQAHLHASYSSIQLIIAGYTFVFAMLLITAGRMGDIFGYKRLFLIGVGGFTLASLSCGIAPNETTLIAARLLQGAMAALMIPQVTSFIQLMYQSKDRIKILGLIGLMGGIAAALGPLLAGFLLHLNPFGLEWRALFLINVPLGVITLIIGYFVIPSGKSSHPPKVDNIGTLLVVAAFGLLMFPLIEGRELGWPIWTIALLVSSIPTFMLLVWQQRRRVRLHGTALLELSLFKKRTFVGGLMLSIIVEMVMAGLFLTLTLLLQVGYHFSAFSAALSMLPVVTGLIVSISMVGGVLVPKIGRYVITLGSALMAIGLIFSAWSLSRNLVSVNIWSLAPSLLIAGLGIGCVIGPLFAVSLAEIDARHAGAGSGVLEAVEQFGGSVGVVLIGGIFFSQLVGNGSASFLHAYAISVVFEVILLALLAGLSFTLPRNIRNEDDLKNELGIEK